jgi:hypothetical protein
MAQDNKIDEWPEAEWGKNAKHNYGMATESPKLVSEIWTFSHFQTEAHKCHDAVMICLSWSQQAAERGPDNLHSFSQCISEMELVGFVRTIYTYIAEAKLQFKSATLHGPCHDVWHTNYSCIH